MSACSRQRISEKIAVAWAGEVARLEATSALQNRDGDSRLGESVGGDGAAKLVVGSRCR